MAKNPPLLQGAIALACLFALQMAIATLRVRSGAMCELIDNDPRLIMLGDKMLFDQMKKARITESDLRAKLREANVLDWGQIEAVVAETTGDISVLHRGEDSPRLNPALLKGVIGAEQLQAVAQP